ncbi:MAG: hypothetical protein Q9208_007282 [Pyrenodesmia sp. 3 TL-2023]
MVDLLQLLIHVLVSFPTLSLLHLRLVSHRFLNVIIRIVHQRLLLAASLEDRKLILECYHPSAQYTEPYVFCEYLGTPGLSSEIEVQDLLHRDLRVEQGRLKHLYSRFRPSRSDASTRTVRPHPAGEVPGSRTSSMPQSSASKVGPANPDPVTHRLFLDAHELFTQLSITAALVQVGPRRGVFLSFIDIIDKKHTRVWRQWLAEKAKELKGGRDITQEDVSEASDDESKTIIWADSGKTLGLRVHVKESKWRKDAPILVHKDEDQAVSYSLELEELLVSTPHLLLAVERSFLERGSDGKAMIFGSFVSTTASNAVTA